MNKNKTNPLRGTERPMRHLVASYSKAPVQRIRPRGEEEEKTWGAPETDINREKVQLGFAANEAMW